MTIKQIREEDCQFFNVRKLYDSIKSRNIVATIRDNYLLINSDYFLSLVSEQIGPLPQQLSPTERIIIEQQFINMCQYFTEHYSSVMLILKGSTNGK